MALLFGVYLLYYFRFGTSAHVMAIFSPDFRVSEVAELFWLLKIRIFAPFKERFS